MEDFRVDGMPNPSPYAVVKELASAIDVLSTSEKYPVSVWALHEHLSETCEEAKGEKSAAFFSVTIAKGLDQMKQTEMVERKANGLRLTEHGRWDLLKRGVTKVPAGSLLTKNEAKLSALGVNVRSPELLMEMEELKWSMDEFLRKVGDFAPTLVLIKMKNGTECGGVAGVPWPKDVGCAAEPAKGSFIFSLGATPARFDLVKPEKRVVLRHRHVRVWLRRLRLVRLQQRPRLRFRWPRSLRGPT
jgi:hypothetical protein